MSSQGRYVDGMSDERFYTKKEVADLLHWSERTVDRRIKAGLLTAEKLGTSVRITEASYRDYVTRGCPATQADDVEGQIFGRYR